MLSYNEFINQMEEREMVMEEKEMVKIHFLDVGEGDCTVIEHKTIEHETNRVSVIDICKGNTDPIKYLKEYIKPKPEYIFRFILTHPDMDHLTGFKDLFTHFEVLNFWDRKHQKEIKEFKSEYEEQDWNCYQKYRSSSEEEESPKVLTLYRGAQNKYYNEDGLHIISPTKDLEEQCDKNEDWNNMSYVILHKVYGKKILYCGDSEDLAWNDILKDINQKDLLKDIDILFAPHHGRGSGGDKENKYLDTLNPKLAILGNASSEHKGYSLFYNRKIPILTNTEAGNIILHVNKEEIKIKISKPWKDVLSSKNKSENKEQWEERLKANNIFLIDDLFTTTFRSV